MGLLSFVKRVGNKVADGIHSAARVGGKVLGVVNSVGNKIAAVGRIASNVVSKTPLMANPFVRSAVDVVKTGSGLVQDVASAAGSAKDLLERGDNLVRQGQSALNKGDVAGAIQSVRNANVSNMGRDAASLVQKASSIIGSGAVKSSSVSAPSVMGTSKSNINNNVVQQREAMRKSSSNSMM